MARGVVTGRTAAGAARDAQRRSRARAERRSAAAAARRSERRRQRRALLTQDALAERHDAPTPRPARAQERLAADPQSAYQPRSLRRRARKERQASPAVVRHARPAALTDPLATETQTCAEREIWAELMGMTFQPTYSPVHSAGSGCAISRPSSTRAPRITSSST